MSGSDINDKIDYLTDDSSINEFRRGTIEEYNQAKDNFSDDYNIISTDESPLPTYMWYDGENVLYYSDAENIYMSPKFLALKNDYETKINENKKKLECN